MRDKPFVPGDISAKIDAASESLFPKELKNKPMAHMTQSELFQFMSALLGMPVDAARALEVDKPENKDFMEEVCDALGNNGDPIMPEDLDTFLDETDAKHDRGE